MADAEASKAFVRKNVWVRVPLRALSARVESGVGAKCETQLASSLARKSWTLAVDPSPSRSVSLRARDRDVDDVLSPGHVTTLADVNSATQGSAPDALSSRVRDDARSHQVKEPISPVLTRRRAVVRDAKSPPCIVTALAR